MYDVLLTPEALKTYRRADVPLARKVIAHRKAAYE